MKPRKYLFNNSTLTIIFGNIIDSKAEVLVSSDDTDITMGGGVSKSILTHGGPSIQADAKKKLPAQIGDVVVSSAGDFKCAKFIFHCLTLERHGHKEGGTDLEYDPEAMHNYILRHSVDKCFRLLQALDINSIAFPCIGAGAANIPLKKVAEVMADAISANLCKTNKSYEIELYLYDRYHTMAEIDYIDMFENFAIKAAMARYKSELAESQYTEEPTAEIPVNIEIPKREEMNHHVFISYSRKNKEQVTKIKDLLTANGIQCWIDTDGVFSGDNFKEVIVDAINVAKAVLFASSAESNESRYVIREISYASKNSKTIVPVRLDDAPYAKSISLDIPDIDQIEWHTDREEAKKRLINSLTYILNLR